LTSLYQSGSANVGLPMKSQAVSFQGFSLKLPPARDGETYCRQEAKNRDKSSSHIEEIPFQ
jgi:hypothetical protein